MKILFISRDVTPAAMTGDAIHVLELADNMAKLGHKVYLVGRDVQDVSGEAGQVNQPGMERLTENPNVELLLMQSKYKFSNKLIKNINGFMRGIELLRKDEIDVIYSRPAAPFDIRIETLFSKLFKVPLVLEINGIGPIEYQMRIGKKPSIIIEFMALFEHRYMFSFSKRFVAVTQGIADILHKRYLVPLEKLSVIPNGTNIEIYKPSDINESREQLSKKIKPRTSLNKDSKAICFVGNFDPWHGLQDLVDAAEIVVKEIPDTVFILVGDGELRQNIEDSVNTKGMKNNFIFTGRVPYEDVPLYINAGNITLAPYQKQYTSTIELSPLKLYSYLACGKPVVTTDIGGIADLVRESKAGLVVKANDPPNMARGILELLNDKPRQRLMGKRGRQYIVKNCTWKHTAEKVVDVCKNAINI